MENLNNIKGLTEEEVHNRTELGQVNSGSDVKTKSYGQILKDNIFSLFNLVNVILLVCILITGELKNAIFFLVVIWNFLIGTLQEMKAKKTVERLSLLSSPKARVIRDGAKREIASQDLVLGDVILLEPGDQICADACIIDGSINVNESLVTGESDAIYKDRDSLLLSGSFVVSGTAMAEVIHVGADNYVQKITNEARHFKKPESVIMHATRMIVRAIAICMIPLAALLVWNNFFASDLDFSRAMVKTVAAISSMIPSGLVLLVSMVLAVSVVRLSRHKTLVRDLYSVENLARVDTLLLDKTGTITEGKLSVEKIELTETGYGEEKIIELLNLFLKISPDKNSTSSAIEEYLAADKPYSDSLFSGDEEAQIRVPFSSDNKWALVYSENFGSLILGAPDRILNDSSDVIKEQILRYAEDGRRVVLFAVSEKKPLPLDKNRYDLPEDIIPAAIIVISDNIRASAPDTFRYFRNEGVDIKVISGDMPATVSRIAVLSGLDHADSWIDATELKSYDDIRDAVNKYTVFGRVSPFQKCDIIKALKEEGHTVAMIGDGANDVMALREADCSVAMQSGSDAARNISNMVILDSDFSSLPEVVAEGRKSINNLQRSAALYLSKTTYAIIFSLFFIFASNEVYPFENIQVTLIGAVTIGIPSFFLALESNNRRIKEHFLYNVFKIAVPTGILESVSLMVLLRTLESNIATEAEISAACVYLMIMIGIISILNICGKLNWFKAALIAFIAGVSAAAIILFPGLFSVCPISWNIWKHIIIISAAFLICHFLVIRILIPALEKKKK